MIRGGQYDVWLSEKIRGNGISFLRSPNFNFNVETGKTRYKLFFQTFVKFKKHTLNSERTEMRILGILSKITVIKLE
jgi:hypothetical protein